MEQPIGAILQNVADEMLEGLQVIGRDWRYLYVNGTVAAQGKRKKDELMGRTMMECYPGIDATPLFVQLRRVMDERVSIRMENEFAFPDGSKGWFLLCIRPVQEGIMILSVDISERKAAEDALKKKIEELNEMMENAVGRELRMVELKRTVLQLKEMAETPVGPVIMA